MNPVRKLINMFNIDTKYFKYVNCLFVEKMFILIF